MKRAVSLKSVLFLAAAATLVAVVVLDLPAGADEPTAAQKARTEGATLIPSAELWGMYVNNIVLGETPSGYTFRTEVDSDGTIPANDKRGEGVFTVPEDGTACMRFDDVWDGKPRCWHIYRSEEGFKMFQLDGSFAADLVFQAKDSR